MTPISAPVATNSSLACRGRMPPWPKASPASRYSGIGEKPDPSGEAAQQAQAEDDRPEFDEHGGGVVHGLYPSERSVGDGVDALAGAHDDERCRRRGSGSRGSGEGTASVRRSTATIDAPVRVRAWVSPSVRPLYGGPRGRSGCAR